MKPEPLKNEIYTLDQLRKMNKLDGNKQLVFVLQLKEAIQWLKENIVFKDSIIEPRIGKEIIKVIDEAFPDLNVPKLSRKDMAKVINLLTDKIEKASPEELQDALDYMNSRS